MAIAPPGNSATSTQLPVGLLARLLRQRTAGSWSAAMTSLICMVSPRPPETDATWVTDSAGAARSPAMCSLTLQVHVQMLLHRYCATVLCRRRLQRPCACGRMRLSASDSPAARRSDGDDSTPIDPREQCGQRRGPVLAGTGGGDGRRGERELAAMARAGLVGLDMVSACRRPLARPEPETGPRGP